MKSNIKFYLMNILGAFACIVAKLKRKKSLYIDWGNRLCGLCSFSKYILVRTCTKQRMKKRLKEACEIYLQGEIDDNNLDQRLQSYLRILSHANEYTLSVAIRNAYWIRKLKN